MTMTQGATAAQLQAVAKALQTDRSPNHIKALAARYGLEESYVELVAESVVSRQFIFESAPSVVDPAKLLAARKLVAESDGTPLNEALTATELRQYRLAERLRDEVNAAESKPINQSTIQELEALAAAYMR